MSFDADLSSYSLAAAHAEAVARRARMSGNIPDPGPMSPKEYDQQIRYPQWRGARMKAKPTQPQQFVTWTHPIRLPARKLRVENIIAAVSEFYKVPRIDIKSNRRTAVVVRPRQIVMYLARTMTGYSFPEIGRRLGGRDHTTALHGYLKIKELRTTDTLLNADLMVLESRLSAAPEPAPDQVIYFGA